MLFFDLFSYKLYNTFYIVLWWEKDEARLCKCGDEYMYHALPARADGW